MARPATGQTPVVSFRPPQALRTRFDALAEAEGLSRTEALIRLMHEYVDRRERDTERPTPPVTTPQ